MKILYYLLPFSLWAQNCTIELNTKFPLTLECSGPYRILFNDNSSSFEAKSPKKALVKEKNFGLIWGDEINPYQDFTIVPIKEARLLLNGIQYPGSLHFAYGKKITNHVDIDLIVHVMMQQKYLLPLSPQTLQALAIALRTDLYFDPRAIPQDELSYQGCGVLYQYPKIYEAIKETSCQIMTYHNKPFATTYCLDAGGKNASFSAIFRQNISSPKGQLLPCLPTHKWEKTFTKQQLISQLQSQGLKNLSFYQDQPSSKIYAVKLEDQKGTKAILIEPFMSLLDLPSNDFSLETKDDTFIFKGQGLGLGVGLCLKTAENLAQQGLDAQAILKQCYPEIEFSITDK